MRIFIALYSSFVIVNETSFTLSITMKITTLLTTTIALTLLGSAIVLPEAKADFPMTIGVDEGFWYLSAPDADTTISAYGSIWIGCDEVPETFINTNDHREVSFCFWKDNRAS